MINKIEMEWKKKRGKSRCVLCGHCVVACPNDALRFNRSSDDLTFDDEIIINHSKCTGCGKCTEACPEIGGMIKLKNGKNKTKTKN